MMLMTMMELCSTHTHTKIDLYFYKELMPVDNNNNNMTTTRYGGFRDLTSVLLENFK